MAVTLTIAGQTFEYPSTGEDGWGEQATLWAVAVSTQLLQRTGGLFALTAEVDFGSNFGVKTTYLKSRGTNPATSGVIRFANTDDALVFRNAANNGNLILKTDSSNNLTYNGVIIAGSAAYTANRAIISSGAGVLTAATTTATEIGYVNGVTSAIQTQLNARLALAGGTMVGVLVHAAGTVGAPSGTWGDSGTGVYKLATNELGVAANGILSFRFAENFAGLPTFCYLNITGAAPLNNVIATGNVADTLTLSGDVAPNVGGQIKLYARSASFANGIEFRSSTLLAGSVDASGKWIFGETAGTQIHAVNGGMSFTLAFTCTQISTPSNPASGKNKLYFKNDENLYSLTSAGIETRINTSYATLAVSTLKTGAYSVLSSDDYVRGDSSGGTFDFTLPTAVGIAGKVLQLEKTDSSFTPIGVLTTGGQTIEGAASKKLATQGEVLTVMSDGANWKILSRRIPSVWTSYTPSGAWSSNSTYVGKWKRDGANIICTGTITLSGAPNSATASVTVPSGLLIEHSDIPGALGSIAPLGTGNALDDSGLTVYTLSVNYLNSDAAHVWFREVASRGDVTQAVPFTWANQDILLFNFSAPIAGWEG